MNYLFEFYEEELGGKDFYNVLNKKSKEFPELFNASIIYPENSLNSNLIYNEIPIVKSGDVRVDMPIICGNINSKNKVLILGLEPRHTDNMYNIMRIENKVFATPFGIDKWYSKSKQSIYASAFEKFLKLDYQFVFSDFVKEYEVPDSSQKNINDFTARHGFEKKFENKYKAILEKEIDLIQPTLVIGLGKTDINKKVDKSWLQRFNINVISHPTNGNYNKMQEEMSILIK
jgi:hypothetical protein